MRPLLRWIARAVSAIKRVGARGIRRWSALPVGVQVGVIVGAFLAANAWGGAAWTAVLLFLWSLPGWVDRVTPGSIKQLLAAARRNPWIAIFAFSAPLSLLHPVMLASQSAGETGLAGAAIGLLIPLLLGIPSDTQAVTGMPSFVVGSGVTGVPASDAGGRSIGRSTHVGPSLITLAGAALVVVATFIPWVRVTLPTYGTVDLDGLYGQDHMMTDGAVTLIIGVVLAVAGMARLSARGHAGWRRGVAIALGIGVAALAIWLAGALGLDMAGLLPPAAGTVGPGVVVVGFGGMIAAIGGLLPGRPIRTTITSPAVGASPFTPVSRSRTGLFVRGQR